MMSMVRLNVPSVFIYGGSILPGRYKGKDVTVVDVFEAVGKHLRTAMTAMKRIKSTSEVNGISTH
jgi:dihydroxy-acid dehydratase